MLKKKSTVLLMVLMFCLVIFTGCTKEEPISADGYSAEDAQALIAEIVPDDIPELDLETMHISIEAEVEIDGMACYSIVVYENDVAIAYYAVKKDGVQWYKLNIETDKYEEGANG